MSKVVSILCEKLNKNKLKTIAIVKLRKNPTKPLAAFGSLQRTMYKK